MSTQANRQLTCDGGHKAAHSSMSSQPSSLSDALSHRSMRMDGSAHPPDLDLGILHIGTFVLLRDLDTGECESYELVSHADSDPSHGRLCTQSALGRLVAGRNPGAIIGLETGRRPRRLRLLDVESRVAW